MNVSDETALSEREIEILQSLADGKTLEQTAMSLGIAYVTVRSYVTAVRDKLDCPTTVNVVVTAVRRGFID